jgi:capsular exopolysaccharide synthesis family protein
VYESSTVMSVTSGRSDVNAISTKDNTLFLAATYAQLATTQPVLIRAIASSHLPITESTAEARVSAAASTDVGFLTITAQGPNPGDAAKLANAVAKSLNTEINNQQDAAIADDLKPVDAEIATLQTQLNALTANSPQRANLEQQLGSLIDAEVTRRTQPRDRIDVLSRATPSFTVISPKPTRDALLAFIVALVLAAELSVGLRVWSDRFSADEDPEAIAAYVGLPLLATIPRGNEREVVEAFRTLRTTLMILPDTNTLRSVAIVSGNANAGKSFVSINLARSAAGLDTHVILIDADLRRPSIHTRLNIPREPGLTEVLRGDIDVRDALYTINTEPRFRALPSGNHIADPAGALGGRAFKNLVDSLAEPRYFVVVDTPPAGPFVDALNVASQCDATVFVLDVKTSRRRSARRTIESLQRSGANIRGVVVNRISGRQSTYYDYYYTSP